MEDDLIKKMDDNLKKIEIKSRPQKKRKTTNNKKNLFFIPLKFRGKPFLGLAQLSKIIIILS